MEKLTPAQINFAKHEIDILNGNIAHMKTVIFVLSKQKELSEFCKFHTLIFNMSMEKLKLHLKHKKMLTDILLKNT